MEIGFKTPQARQRPKLPLSGCAALITGRGRAPWSEATVSHTEHGTVRQACGREQKDRAACDATLPPRG